MSIYCLRIALFLGFIVYILFGVSSIHAYSCKKCEQYDSNGSCINESEVCCDSGSCPSGYSGSCNDRNECGSCGSVMKTCPDGTKTCGECFVPKPWYRLNSASFHKKNSISDPIPLTITPFDDSDTDQTYLTIQDNLSRHGAGLITSEGSIYLGPYTSEVSSLDWSLQNYSHGSEIRTYIDYFHKYSRKQKKVNIISSISEIDSNTINIYENTEALSFSDLPNHTSYVLLTKSDIVIDDNPSHVVNPLQKSLSIISMGTMYIHPDIREINGILIADNYDFAHQTDTSQYNLKINGNLISGHEITELKRGEGPYDSASLYVVFNPKMYSDLIPHLSTLNIGKKQIQ